MVEIIYRKATPEDIVKDAIISYENEDYFDEGDKYFHMKVAKVLNPSDMFKAFVAEDGCRYGLDGALLKMHKLCLRTDLDRTKEFLDSLGVLYNIHILEDNCTGLEFGSSSGSGGDDYPKCDKVGGYTGFSTQFEFDKNGKFLTVGAWE